MSVRPLIGTEEELRATIVIFSTETYDEGKNRLRRNTVRCNASLDVSKKVSLHYSYIPKGTGGLVVPARLEKLHRR